MQEIKELNDTHEGMYVRIIRSYRDVDDRLTPEVYRATRQWGTAEIPGRPWQLINVLTNEQTDVPKAGCGKLFVFTPNEAATYLTECSQRAYVTLEYLQSEVLRLSYLRHTCDTAIAQVFQAKAA